MLLTTKLNRPASASRRGAVLVAGALAISLVVVVPASSQAEPAGGAPPDAAAPGPSTTETSAGLAMGPKNFTWAKQILDRYLGPGEAPTIDINELGYALDSGKSATGALSHYLRTGPQIASRVGELYEQLLDRPADPGGYAFWASRIERGVLSYENLIVSLLLSNEAWTKAGATNDGYVDWVYEHLLGRNADPGGEAHWVARLDSGTSRDRFARSFLRSPERARSVVRHAFEQYLWRDADPAGLTHWVNLYTSARVGELDLAVALLASNELRNSGCGHDPSYCLLPFPSNRYANRDNSLSTGWRVGFKPEWMPANASGTHINPAEWNRNDGFSTGQSMVTRVPGIDLEETGAAPLDDIEASLDPDVPVVLIDASSGERVPYFVELDANAPDGSPTQMLYIRPAVNLAAGHHFAIVLRNLKDEEGDVIPPNPGWAAEFQRVIVDGETRSSYDVDLTFGANALMDVGVDFFEDDVFQAWTFTTATAANTSGRMLHIRDDALDRLDGDAPAFTVDTITANPREGVAKRVEGTFQVSQYLVNDGGPGQYFSPLTPLPERQRSYTARYDCEIPTLEADQKARTVVYGHGLFGSRNEVRSSPQAAMVRDHDMAYCATDWIGMSDTDLGNAVNILQDLSNFRSLVDRSQQGILNTIMLGRLMHHEEGFVSHAAFQEGDGDPLLDIGHLFYDGNSQGAVIGGAYVAVDPDVEAGVLGVAGMNYSILLERSVDFDPFFDIMQTTYPDRGDQVISLQLIQMLWDRGETNGYAAHLNADNNLPGTVDKRVLIHTALGDHQVATLTAEIEARTAGIPIHRPVYGPGRTTDVDPAWGLDAIDYPSNGSGLIVWDSGAALSPLTNVPPRTGEDPHGDPRAFVDAEEQKAAFLAAAGILINVCGANPCTAPSD